MKKVEIHKILSNGNISDYYDEIITDIDTNDRIFRLFGLQYGLGMEKVEGDIYQSQYGEKFIIIRWNHSLKYDGRLQVPSPHTINGKSKGG